MTGYAILAGVTAIVCVLLQRNPFETPAWLGTTGLTAAILSAGLGVMLGGATVAATAVLVKRVAWVRALHDALRPVVHGEGDIGLLAAALASGIAEELFFRGLFVPLIGIVFSSLLFGVVHQVRGGARWGWMAWAMLMGLLFALVFRLTGSLVGPIVAHVYVNAQNLRFLRDTSLAPRRPRAMGGLLGPR